MEQIRIHNTHREQSHVDTDVPMLGTKLALNAQFILSDAVVAINHRAVVVVQRGAVWLVDREVNIFW
jgi:hypothetical protein